MSAGPRTLKCSLALANTVIYTSEKRGSDESGDGSRDRPFKSVLQALRAADGKEPLPAIKVDAKTEGEVSLPHSNVEVQRETACNECLMR